MWQIIFYYKTTQLKLEININGLKLLVIRQLANPEQKGWSLVYPSQVTGVMLISN